MKSIPALRIKESVVSTQTALSSENTRNIVTGSILCPFRLSTSLREDALSQEKDSQERTSIRGLCSCTTKQWSIMEKD